MLSAITEELSQVVRKLSTTMIHLGDLFIPNEYNIDVTSKKYATEKYRIQHCLGKMKFMQIPGYNLTKVGSTLFKPCYGIVY